MNVIGLCGRSGTGKSYKAVDFAKEVGADAIIDDGLLIAKSKIIAGTSAKKQPTKIGAIKTAVFTDEDHAKAVRKALKENNFSLILVLGTSEKMIKGICERLLLPNPLKIVMIEEISTQKEIEIATEKRTKEGIHTIPVPTIQVKKQFSGFLIDPRRAFGKKENKTKTVIRPNYSYLGSYEISQRVIQQIIEHVVGVTAGCSRLLFSSSVSNDEGTYIRVIILGEEGNNLIDAARLLQQRITQVVSHMTSLVILGVEVEIRGYK